MKAAWDYLIITAANDAQAAAYRTQLDVRVRLGLVNGVAKSLVVPDLRGKRIGSGTSTLLCLVDVLARECTNKASLRDPATWESTFRRLRVLIVHAGGDARRLPAYSPCGKIFVPIPGESDGALGMTLLDRQLPRFLDLPAPPQGMGQIVVASGDVILEFDPSEIRFDEGCVTGVGFLADPRLAANHGVFISRKDGRLRKYLQKPSVREQERNGAVDRHGRSLLDVGIINMDAVSARRLLTLFDWRLGRNGRLELSEQSRKVAEQGIDIYREICCAFGEEGDLEFYRREVKKAGSTQSAAALKRIYRIASGIPFRVGQVSRCSFLHFGTTRQLIDSGARLIGIDYGTLSSDGPVSIDNEITGNGVITGRGAWIEGCRIRAPLILQGENAIIGVDVDRPLTLPKGACLDVIEGHNAKGATTWIVRCYGVDDVFHRSHSEGGSLCGLPLDDWVRKLDASTSEVWASDIPAQQRTVWNGRFFPSMDSPDDYFRWLWLFDPERANPEQKEAWRRATRYSFAQAAGVVNHEAFHSRRAAIRAHEVRRSFGRIFRLESGFSSADLSYLLQHLPFEDREKWIAFIVKESYRQYGRKTAVAELESFGLSRVLHTLGSAINSLLAERTAVSRNGSSLGLLLTGYEMDWLESLGLRTRGIRTTAQWGRRASEAAFRHLGRVIVTSGESHRSLPRNHLRDDEIVWGRAPARLDLCGGWTDTPPYSLERGGCVLNAAVDLNGQSPIQVYARVIKKPEIRIGSIDHGVRLTINEMEDLLDYRKPTSKFSLAKAALALSGFSPGFSASAKGGQTLGSVLKRFGGGLELTSLAAIPSGSGLGTSSIMGAVLMAVIGRVIGRSYSSRELFHAVLQLEQELTTGGGWQDQIGGVVDGVKVIKTAPGLVSDPTIHFVPPDVMAPESNQQQTLLYYTGIRRLAKNILSDIVGHYLDRDRSSLETLKEMQGLPAIMSEAMSERSITRFGELVDAAWRLNKRLDPDSSTPVIEGILARIRTHIYGAKLLGAGGGGFLFMVCRSVQDASTVRSLLTSNPPNERARFFDYSINNEGLVVTAC